MHVRYILNLGETTLCRYCTGKLTQENASIWTEKDRKKEKRERKEFGKKKTC